MRRLSRVIGAGAVFFFITGVAAALDVLPEIVQLAGPHRARLYASLTLVNDSPHPVDVRLEIGRGGIEEDGWIRVSPHRVRLKPGKKKAVRIKVRVPYDGQGERSTQVRAVTRPVGGPVEYRLVRLVNLRIVGTEKYNVALGRVDAEIQPERVVVTVGVENKGNVTIIPVCEAKLILGDGRSVRAYQDGGVGSVPPGGNVRVRVEVPLSGSRWTGSGVVCVNYKDAGGNIHRVEKTVGD